MPSILELIGSDVVVHKTALPGLGVLQLKQPISGADLPIEERVGSFLSSRNAKVARGELEAWLPLWTLLYWEVIFANVDDYRFEIPQGPFPSKLQDIPPDMTIGGFFANRAEAFKARDSELKHRPLPELLKTALSRYANQETRLLEGLDDKLKHIFLEITECFPSRGIVQLLSRISLDPFKYRKGLPDLIIISPEPCLIELKSEKDTIRQDQIDWLRYSAGRCELTCYVLVEGWSDSKAERLALSLSGPKGKLELMYGHSSSKYFAEVEEEVASWTNVRRTGDGKSLQVIAELPLREAERALPTIEKVVRWKNAKALVDGVEVDLTQGSPIRCMLEKESQFAGEEHCIVRYEYDYEKRVVPCKLFYHHYVDGGNMSDFGYRDSDRMVFVLDKEKLKGELVAFREKLSICPFFPHKKLDKLIDGIPDMIDPAQDNEWGWLDSNYRPWIFDDNYWISGWGDAMTTPPTDAVTVSRVDRDERRRIKADFRKSQKHEAELQASLAALGEESRAASSKKGCLGLVVSVLVGAALLSIILTIIL